MIRKMHLPAIFFCQLVIALSADAVLVNGHCYLWNQTNHDSIKILFWEYYYHTPLDSTYTDSTGYYQIDVAQDNYDIQFRHLGYYNHEKYNQYINSNTTFRNIFLHPAPGTPIQGRLTGILPADTFLVWDNITVQQWQDLLIQPGAVLLFDGRFGFNVEGSLSAIGTETDSIKFMPSPVNPGWQGIRLRSSQFSIMEYCLVSGSLYRGIEGGSNSTIRHCTITNTTRTMSSNGDGIVCWNSSPTIEYCTISNNENRGIFCTFDASPVIRNCTISGNSCGITLSGDGNPIIQNCTITGNSGGVFDEGGGMAVFSSSPLTISNCTITNNYSYYGGGVYISTDSYITMKNCNISENSARHGGGIYVTGNYPGSFPRIENCTIRGNSAQTYGGGIYTTNTTASIINSIIADNIGGGGIHFAYQSDNVWIFHCNFHNNYEGNFHGLYLPIHLGEIDRINANGDSCDYYYNILLNPRFRGGEPFDCGLQANSPCIDAGSPNSPIDPDGTIADMGAYFFDQNHNQPPVLYSPYEIYVRRRAPMRYVARATDDHGMLQFGFWNLPPWLNEEEIGLDWVEDSAAISGNVPSNQDDFSFGVWVEDDQNLRDSMEVSVHISAYHPLSGIITGVLTALESPYLVVEDILIPPGDTLRIEPGVEIRFQWHDNENQRRRILVMGNLQAIGTPEDTIRFIPEFGDSLDRAWQGIWCSGLSTDTSKISYAYFSYARHAVVADSQCSVVLDHSRFYNDYRAIRVFRNSWVGIDSCHFQAISDNYMKGIFVETASATITNSTFEYPVSEPSGYCFQFRENAVGFIRRCTFIRSVGGEFNMYSYGEFIRNTLIGGSQRISFGNYSDGVAANNIFKGGIQGLFVYNAGTVVVSNNVFYNMNLGLEIAYGNNELPIRNNLFFYNRISIENYSSDPTFTNISYCDFYDNDVNWVNCEPDTTNIFLDPLVQDTIDFRLQLGSPCIDAGDPNPFFNDPDSTRNDIGAWGGPWGESYPYSVILPVQTKPIPLEFALHPPYPNPFNASTVIKYTLPYSGNTNLSIYNILGQEVTILINRAQQPGTHSIIWDAANLPSGIYFARLKCRNYTQTQKMLLLK